MINQLALSIRLQDEATFDNFFLGDNEEVVTTLKRNVLTVDPICIFLAGGRGFGKSHLLQASCQHACTHNISSFYLPIEMGLSPIVLENLDDFSLICIDNLEAIAGDQYWEEALFHFFNRSVMNRSRLFFASEKLPMQAPFSLVDLVSRLASGITYCLKSLSDDQKIEAMQQRAQNRGFMLSRDVGQYLLNHYPRNMSDLFDLFEKLDRASLRARHKLTVPFVKAVLNNH